MFETVFLAVLSDPLSMLRRQMPVCRFPHRDFTDLFGEDDTWYILLSAPGVQMAAKSERIAFTYSATSEELSSGPIIGSPLSSVRPCSWKLFGRFSRMTVHTAI